MRPGWTDVALGDVATITMGQAPVGSSYNNSHKGLPLIAGAGDFTPHAIQATKWTTDPTKEARPNDIVLSIRASIGDRRIADRTYCLGRGVAGLRAQGKSLNDRFLWHWLGFATAELRSRGRGATFLRVNRNNIASLTLRLPPLDEQRRIAAILDHVDALRAQRRQTISLVESMASANFDRLFGSAADLTQRWPTAKIRDTGAVQLGRQRSPKYLTGKNARPYLRVANVQLNALSLTNVLEMDFDEREFPIYRLEHGDVLLNEGQNTEFVGRPAMWRGEIEDCCFQNSLVRYRADRDRVAPEFALHVFLHYLRLGVFARISAKTSNMAHLGAGRFGDLPFPLPPIELQHQFATRLSAIDTINEANMRHLAELDVLFASLQGRAFAGELDVDNVRLPPA